MPTVVNDPEPTVVDELERTGADARLRILVNGEAREIPSGTTVERLLELLALGRRRVAVAVNRSVVPRSDFGRRAVAAGDRVEILEAVGGG